MPQLTEENKIKEFSSLIKKLQKVALDENNTNRITELLSSFPKISFSKDLDPFDRARIMQFNEDGLFTLILIIMAMIEKKLLSDDIKIVFDFALSYLRDHIQAKSIKDSFPLTNSLPGIRFRVEHNPLLLISRALGNTLSNSNHENANMLITLLERLSLSFSCETIYRAYAIKSLAKITYTSEFTGTAYIEHEEYEHSENSFEWLFAISKLKSAQENNPFILFLFEKLLGKFDQSPEHIKYLVFNTFKEHYEDYINILEIYLSQITPEKIKTILEGETLLSKIIKIKSRLQTALETTQQYTKLNFYEARKQLLLTLSTEINRLRKKTFLNDTDIEISNILVKIRLEFKKLMPEENADSTPSLSTYLASAISELKNIDNQTTNLFLTTQFIKSWYLTEYEKTKTLFLTALKFIEENPENKFVIQQPDNLPQPTSTTQKNSANSTQQHTPVSYNTMPLPSKSVASSSSFTANLTVATVAALRIPQHNIPQHNSLLSQVQVPSHRIEENKQGIDSCRRLAL